MPETDDFEEALSDAHFQNFGQILDIDPKRIEQIRLEKGIPWETVCEAAGLNVELFWYERFIAKASHFDTGMMAQLDAICRVLQVLPKDLIRKPAN